jgi:hypothetical protein
MTYLKKMALVAVLAVVSVVWFPVLAARGILWDSRRQLWRSRDGQLVDMTGAHVAWAS